MSEKVFICVSCLQKKFANESDESKGADISQICTYCDRNTFCYRFDEIYLRNLGSLTRAALRKKRIESSKNLMKLICNEAQLKLNGNTKICFIDELIVSLKKYRQTLVKE